MLWSLQKLIRLFNSFFTKVRFNSLNSKVIVWSTIDILFDLNQDIRLVFFCLESKILRCNSLLSFHDHLVYNYYIRL